MENTRIEKLTVSHVEGLVELYFQVFKRIRTSEFFMRHFDVKNDELPQFSVILMHEKRVIGFYGVRLIEFSNDADIKLIAEGSNFMVHSDFRRAGYFEKLQNHINQNLQEYGIQSCFGLPNELSHRFLKKSGWRDLKTAKLFILKTLPFPTARLMRKTGLEKWKKNKFKKLLQPYLVEVDLTAINKKTGFYTALYNPRFVEMKAGLEYFIVQIAGCICVLKYNHHITIGFFKTSHESNSKKFIRELKSIARKSGIHEVVFHLLDDTEESDFLEKELESKSGYKSLYFELDSENSAKIEDYKFNFFDADLF